MIATETIIVAASHPEEVPSTDKISRNSPDSSRNRRRISPGWTTRLHNMCVEASFLTGVAYVYRGGAVWCETRKSRSLSHEVVGSCESLLKTAQSKNVKRCFVLFSDGYIQSCCQQELDKTHQPSETVSRDLPLRTRVIHVACALHVGHSPARV